MPSARRALACIMLLPGMPTRRHAMQNGQDVSDDLANMKDDFAALRESVASLARNMLDEGKAKASDMGGAIRSKAKAGIDAAETRIKERPILFVLLALFAGVILGRLVMMRRA
jgi:ElaB/YqjD/DUF883 family membrane-anchored ribosome-binding protein